MGMIYGSGFEPGKIYTGEVKDKEKKTASDTAIFTAARVAIALSFIFLSFIPVVGEVGEAALIGAETAIEASTEAAIEATTEAAIESAVAASEATDVINTASQIANTARNIRLGDTISGSVGLGVGEALANEALDRIEGTQDTVNSILNFALAFTPVYGAVKGRRLANVRFAQTIDRQLAQQYELLQLSTSVEQRLQIETRIRQIKNARLVRTSKIFGAPIDSYTVKVARQETLNIIDKELQSTNKLYVKKIANELKRKVRSQELRLTKTEARQIVRSVSRQIPSIGEGITLKGIFESKTYNRILGIARVLDPNLATRKVFTAAARKLSSNEALLRFETKNGTKEFGKWFKKVNFGYYKKFGQKLSAWWRKWGKKIYKHSRVRMIPVVSKWIEGYRLISTAIPGEFIMIVIFKPSKSGRVPPPVVVNPVSLAFVEEFSTGGTYGSVGSFYINRIAFARNGSGPSLSGSLASILGPLSLGQLRKALETPAAIERIIRKVSKGDYFDTFFDNISETSNRLWSHKVGKVLAGRWGIATARGFQSTYHGHTSLGGSFDVRHLIDEMGVVTLDKARAVQRKAGIQGRTRIIGGKRVVSQYQRTIKLMTFGAMKFDGKKGIKKGNGIF